jgi:hypothetical protein
MSRAPVDVRSHLRNTNGRWLVADHDNGTLVVHNVAKRRKISEIELGGQLD